MSFVIREEVKSKMPHEEKMRNIFYYRINRVNKYYWLSSEFLVCTQNRLLLKLIIINKATL